MIRDIDKAHSQAGALGNADNGVLASKRKVVDMLNLSTVPASSYSELSTGPFRPGYYFYDLLLARRGRDSDGSGSVSRGPSLCVPIAETLVVDGSRIALLHNDSKGNVVKSRPPRMNETEDNYVQRREFMMSVVKRFIEGDRQVTSNADPIDFTPLSFARRIPLLRLPAAVLKRPAWRRHVASDTEIMLPIPLAATIQEDLKGRSAPHIIQRFIRSRGKKACFYRVILNPATSSSPKSVAVWNISSEADIVDITPEMTQRFFNPELAYGPDECMGVDASLSHLSNSLDRVRDEPTSLIYAGRLVHGEVGESYLCTLAGPDGTTSDELCLRRSVSRVVGRTVGELEVFVDRIAAWFEATSAVQFHLPIRLAELVVDFIRDGTDHWHMIQVKGFRFSAASQEQVHRWHVRKTELREKRAEEGLAGQTSDAGSNTRENGGQNGGHPARAVARAKLPLPPASGAAMRQQLQEAGGVHCKLCGLSFTEGQMVRKTLSVGRLHSSEEVEGMLSEDKQDTITHEVPCHGYQLSMSMACKLAEIYRDAGYPLTLVARDILLDYADILAVPSRGASTALQARRPSHSKATATSSGGSGSSSAINKSSEIQPMGLPNRGAPSSATATAAMGPSSKHSGSGASNPVTISTTSNGLSSIRKKRAGWVVCCHICFEILEEQQRYESASTRLFGALGLYPINIVENNDPNSTITASITAANGISEGTPRPRSARSQGRETAAFLGSAGGGGRASEDTSGYRMMLSASSASSSRAVGASLGADMTIDGAFRTAAVTGGSSASGASLSETCMRMGQPAPWTVHEFDADAGQFRMLIMAQYIVDMKPLDNARLVDNASCKLAYSIGKYNVQLPFVNSPEKSAHEDKLVHVKQCRLHYFFASRRAASQLFEFKRINFNLYVNRRDALKNELQYEGSGSINLQSIRWETNEIQKVDILMPIATHSFGAVVVKLAVAVDFSRNLPWQAANEHFAREKDVFWPCSKSYNDGAPLPELWIEGMLAMGIDRSRANNGYRTNYNSRGEVEWDGGIASGRKVDSSHVLARRGSGNSSAIDDAGTTDKYSKPASAALNKKSPEDSSTLGVSSNQSNTKTNSNSGSSGGGGDSALLDIDKFNAISSLMPFVSHVFDRQRQSADGKTQVIPAIHAIIYALEACILDPTLLNKPFFGTGDELATLVLSPVTARSLIDSLREMEADDIQASDRMAWHEFLDALSGYVGVVLKREKREAMLAAAESRFRTTNASGAETSGVVSGSSGGHSAGGAHALEQGMMHMHLRSFVASGDSVMSGGDGAVMMSTRKGIRLAKILVDLSTRLKGTSIDVMSNPLEAANSHARLLKIADVDPTALPVSRHRKFRRLMYLLAIFEHVSQRSDVADAAELKLYMEKERDTLSEALMLIKNGMLSIPLVTHNFEVDLGSDFSLPRAVICTLLLSSSDKLQQLFDRYTTHGVAGLSHIGFLKTCEESLQYVSSGRCAIKDPVLVEFRALADKAHKKKYKPDARDAIAAAAHGFLSLSTVASDNDSSDIHSGHGGGSSAGKTSHPLIRRHTSLMKKPAVHSANGGGKGSADTPTKPSHNGRSGASVDVKSPSKLVGATRDSSKALASVLEDDESEDYDDDEFHNTSDVAPMITATSRSVASAVKSKTAEDAQPLVRRGSNVLILGIDGTRRAVDAESAHCISSAPGPLAMNITYGGSPIGSTNATHSPPLNMSSPMALNRKLAVAKSIGSPSTPNKAVKTNSTTAPAATATAITTGPAPKAEVSGQKSKSETIAELKLFAKQLKQITIPRAGNNSTRDGSPSTRSPGSSPNASTRSNPNTSSNSNHDSMGGGRVSNIRHRAATMRFPQSGQGYMIGSGSNTGTSSSSGANGIQSPLRAPINPSPPMLVSTCEAHGDELFFLVDMCCSACERGQWRTALGRTE